MVSNQLSRLAFIHGALHFNRCRWSCTQKRIIRWSC
jgi:hypothetical protein